MAYRCRDCGLAINTLRPTSKCPHCGSIYILREGREIGPSPETVSISLSERFLCLILGAIFGLITFFLWGIVVLLKGGAGAGKAAAGAFYLGWKLSLIMAVCVGVIGFVAGAEKMAKVLAIMWGTDHEFNENLASRFQSLCECIPRWLVYVCLTILIAGSWLYLYARLA